MAEHSFRIQDQVLLRRPLANSNGSQLVKVGTIVAFADGGKKAVVQCPSDRTRLTVPVEQLKPAAARFNRARVQIDPVRRNIAFLR